MKHLLRLALAVAILCQGAGAEPVESPHVTGIGGVFFKARGDDKALATWYHDHLGIKLEPWGAAVFKWPEDTAEDRGATVWQVAPKDSPWFQPSESGFMINYRVNDLDGMLARLRQAGVPILKGPESYENGKFAWLLDPEGNKIELWEPMLWDPKNKGN